MWQCPICSSEEKSEYVCRKCGYDRRKDFIQRRTVCEVPEADVKERLKLKKSRTDKGISNDADTEVSKGSQRKSAGGLKKLIPVIGILCIAVIAVFLGMNKDRNRMMSAGVTYEDDLDDLCVLGSDIKRRRIQTITFLDTLKRVPADAWDVSEKQDGSVMAYIRNDNELFFAADGPIKANEDSSYFFAGYTNVEEIHFNEAFYTSDVTDMTGMFAECQNLSNLEMEVLDTSQVTDMSLMFCNIDNWKSVYWELDTHNVTDMSYMFAECDSLEKVSVYGWDMSKVTDTTAMFYNCPKLDKVSGLDSLDLSQVTQDADMFTGCGSLSSKNYEDVWDGYSEIEKNMIRENFEDRFKGDINLTTKKIIFLDSLESAPEDAQDVSKHQDASVKAWIEDDECLIIAANGSVVANSNCKEMFYKFENVVEIDFNDAFDTHLVTDMNWMFSRCYKLEFLNLSGFDTRLVTDMSNMFSYCTALKELDLSSFDTSQVEDMRGMFSSCIGLERLDVSSFDTSRVTYMSTMFYGCHNLKELDVSGFDMDGYHETVLMFHGCNSLSPEVYEGIRDGN